MAIKKEDLIKIGKNVLTTEAKAVESLASRLDDNFVKAVNLIFRQNSRVIITGML